ncbi:DUF2141 domain-containing protein [Salinarimonas soli]|uniref:DUF2141 domain-containing protein n=1 Tax=Salinarimonas soli TaxID=1638099 RepID=A0A5B2VFI2_9HYPH|nr:DUF2141 domain-containing protein [Salinarimonas soli]KAA2238323.1 DUF2141 domain-containing protein [Salinarimonas soli]
MRGPALAALLALMAPAAWASTVTVQVTGVASAEGQVYVGLCRTALDPAACPLGDSRPARPGTMRFTFRNVPAGPIAVAVYQDVNGNGQLDRNVIGIPSEPYGFSNDVGRIAIPTFARAQVRVDEPATTIPVRLARFGG